MLCGFSEQQELAISSLAWIRTFLPAGLVVLFNKHVRHITLLLKASHGFPASSEETWGSPPCCLWGPSGSVPDSPPSLWALPSCVFYVAPAPSAPPWGPSSPEGHNHFRPRHLLLPLPGLYSPHKAPGLHTLVSSYLCSDAHFLKDLPTALHKPTVMLYCLYFPLKNLSPTVIISFSIYHQLSIHPSIFLFCLATRI